MILADDILAARGRDAEIGGFLSSIAAGIERAERFVLTDDVALAGYQLIRSKPTSLVEAMPLCRLPYPTVWLEWNGNASSTAGWQLLPYTERRAETPMEYGRYTPIKMGCLIEGDESGQRGCMTWAWMLPNHDLGASGLSVMFDYSGHVADWGRQALGNDETSHAILEKWATPSPETLVSDVLRDSKGWKKLADNPAEIEAFRSLRRYEMMWPSRHAATLIRSTPPSQFETLMRAWSGDICGEGPFINAVLLMMNSKNAVDLEPNDLSRLNKARARSNKPPLLSHTTTRLHLSKARQRLGDATGMSRAAMRSHLVRGHFKIRRSGVYWWSAFVRGTGRGAERTHYAVDL